MKKQDNVCAIYVRKSRAIEGLGLEESLENQKESLIQIANESGYKIHAVYEEVASSQDANRPQLQAMLKDVLDRKVNTVLVQDLDRLARKNSLYFQIMELFKEYNVLLHTSSQGVIDMQDETQDIMTGLQGVLAQVEYGKIRKRLARGKVQAVAIKGEFMASTAPYGYVLNKETNKLEPHPTEAPVFREMVRLALDGHSYGAIAKAINEQGYRTQLGNKWTPGRVSKLFLNPTYRGQVRYNSSVMKQEAVKDHAHEALLSQEELDTILKLSGSRRNYEIGARSKQHGTWGKVKSSLDGLIYCGRCGHRHSVQICRKKKVDGTQWSFVQIRSCIYKDAVTGEKCPNAGCKFELVEPVVMDYLERHLDVLRADLEELQHSRSVESLERLTDAIQFKQDSLAHIEDKIKRANKLYLNAFIEEDEYKDMAVELRGHRTALQRELEALQRDLSSNDVEGLTEALSGQIESVEGIFSARTVEEQNLLMKKVIKKISYIKDKGYGAPQSIHIELLD